MLAAQSCLNCRWYSPHSSRAKRGTCIHPLPVPAKGKATESMKIFAKAYLDDVSAKDGEDCAAFAREES